jgi:cobalt/nickel transport system ATP-binding protein
MNPEVLVLDEPLAGLDQKSQIWLTAFLKDLKAAGKTLILSTHNEALAHSMADRILYMNENHSLSE